MGGCASSGNCGNANPDPCICGRPDSDPVAKMQCTEKRACEAEGGVWNPTEIIAVDGGITAPHCEAASSDAGTD
jgi:hypothetical protein